MQRKCFIFIAEKLSKKKKQEIVETASEITQKAKRAYSKSLERKEINPNKIEKLFRKYYHMKELSQQKETFNKERARKSRDCYLKHLHQLTESRLKWERMEEEKKQEILKRRTIKRSRHQL